MKLTKAQREALTRAVQFGNAWNYTPTMPYPWSASRQRCIDTLRAAGLLNGNEITEEGRRAL